MENSGNTLKPTAFFRIAGVSALLFTAVIILDIITSIMSGEAAAPGSMTAPEIFALYIADSYRAFQYLGLLNIIEQLLMLPIVFVFYISHRESHKNAAAFSFILYALSLAVYNANNAALPLWHLSAKYAAAASTLKPLITAAGESLLARGEDFTPGSLPGFILNCSGVLLMLSVMLKSGIFGKVPPVIGLIGTSFLTVYTVAATLVPQMYNTLMPMAMLGGMLMLAWYIMFAVKAFGMKAGQA